MKRITLLLMVMGAFIFSANAQLAFNQNPINNSDHLLVAGITLDTVRTITPADNQYVSAEVPDIDITWHWTPSKVGTWTLESTDQTTGARTTGEPTVVNSFYHWPGAGAEYTAQAPAGEYLFPPQTVSTRRGFVMRVTSKDGIIQDGQRNPITGYSQTQSGYFALGGNMTGGGDPVWFNSLDDMKTYATSGMFVLSDNTYQQNTMNGTNPRADYGALNDGLHLNANADYPDGFNSADSAMALVLPKSGNEALSLYPGIFKNIDFRIAFRSDRHQWTRDITFDIFTMDEGNTGKKSTWNIIVSLTYNNIDGTAAGMARDLTDSTQLGDNGSIIGGPVISDVPTGVSNDQVGRRWVAGTYTSGDPLKTINVNKVMGLKPYELFNRTVVIALQTQGTEGDTDNPSGTYDPIIAIDNIQWGGWNVQLPNDATWAESGPLLPVREEEQTGNVWDFTSWSTATLDNMAADPTNWNPANDTRYSNVLAIPAGTPITANGVEVAELKGLTFGALAADRIRIDYGADPEASRMILNGSINFIVPDCKAGDQIQITFKTNTGGSARGVDIVSNATVVGDNTQSTDVSVTNTYTATDDGPVTFKTSAGLQIFKIAVNDTETSIPKIINNDAKIVVRSEYFDLLGRKVNANTKGFVIQKLFYNDGTIGSKKMFVNNVGN